MSLKFGFKTDVGLRRRTNQDGYTILRGETLNGELDALFVIADGMGGRQGGEVASAIVIQTLSEVVTSHVATRHGNKGPVDSARLLQEGIAQAHRRVLQRQSENAELCEMGTTCVAAILDANVLTIANVGDSRAYLLREGRLTQITQDHSNVWEQVVAGNLTPDQARTSRFRNHITRAVGSQVNARPDVDVVELKESDAVLLCSDGLSSELEDAEIERLLAGSSDPQEACDLLVKAALDAGGKDNITIIALHYGEFKPLTLPTREPTVQETRYDPLDAWREAGFDPDGTERKAEISSVRREARGRANSPVLLGLLFIFVVVAGGEAYALIRLYQKIESLRKIPPVIIAPPIRATDRNLNYGPPVSLLLKPVRDTPLAVDEVDSLIAVSKEGNLVRITRQGSVAGVSALPGQTKLSTKTTSAPDSFVIATDLSGNRYQVDPGAKVISKYDPEGQLALGNLGKGNLVRPTAMAIDSAGNIYVIDDHHIKKIPASETSVAPAPQRWGNR